MATAPYPFPYPSAATYPHQIHHHHPFPFGFPSAYAPGPPGPVFFQPPPAQTATTAFSYAATYPYSPPASAYTAASGVSPTPAYGAPPDSPYAATYRYPPPASAYTHAPAPTTSSSPCSQAPPSTPPTGAPSLSASPETTRPRHAYQVPSCPLPSGRSIMPPRLLDNVPTSPNRERTPLQNGLAMEPYANEGLNNTPAASGASTAPTVFGFTTATPLFSNTTASSSSPLTAATTTKVASTPSMFSNTSAATSSSKSYLSYPFGPSCSAPTQACDSVSVMHPSAVPSTMAGVAPKVFGEMPTPISWQGTHGTAPDYCLGHHNLSPSSCASNISEQNLDGKPQPYGFHNLNRHSVLLADGTKHSYYALPENYSLERATSSTSPAIPTVEVSDTYQSFIPPLNDQISEKQTHPGIGIGDMLAQIQAKLETVSEKLSQDIKRMESRASKQQAAPQGNPSTQQAINMTDGKALYGLYNEEANGSSIDSCTVLHTNLIIHRDGEGKQGTEDTSSRKASENETHSSHSPMSASATDQMRFQTFERMPVFDIYDDETEDCSNVFVAVPASPPEQQPSEEEQEEGEKLHKCFSKALETEETNACLSYISAVCDCTLEQQQHNGQMASVNVQQLRAPRLNLLEIDESIGVFASNPRQQPYVAGQQADVQDFLIQLQPQDNERALNCPVFQASDSIVTSSNQASIEHSMKALVWLQSPLFSHLHNQLQRSNTFSVWDPGILNQLDMMLDKIALVHLVHHILTCELFSFIRQPADLKPFWTQFPFQYYSWYNATNALLEGLYVHMIQIVDCMGSARLPPTQISTHASSNTELAVLASRYYSLHLHQITNWTSTTSNGTTSAEYAYTLDFIIDQWELHKQGVQKSYSAMSSPNYLQILEMNILFITFLPP